MYNPDTGVIYWGKSPSKKIKAGQIAGGAKDKDGYLNIKFKGKLYKAHRLAWFLYYTEWPKQEIDHINRIPDDNRIENLRDVSRLINAKNTKNFKFNITKKGNGWQGQTSINGKRIYLGFSLSYEELYNKINGSDD